MEKKLANMELNEEALDEVSGGILEARTGDLGMARYSVRTQQNLDLDVLNLIDVDKTAGHVRLNNIVPTDQVEDKNAVFY